MTPLQPGDKAPSFNGIDQDGKKVSLTSLKGKKVILYLSITRNTMKPVCNLQLVL
ncbi:MAG: hypothetical protein EBV71_07000 [Chitinophagia bacterium]|nr:hypothetical protein [Chitinophagia bacterium]